MLAQLATVKARLGLLETEIQYDALLAGAIGAVSQRFDYECNRTLARTEDFQQEFGSEITEICAACYPIESVTRFELKENETDGWTEQPGVKHLVRKQCVISLVAPLGGGRQQARVTYTGGYVLPGATPGPGQTALPAMLEQAAVEQVAYWFQNRERVGLSRIWDYHATFRHFADLDLLASVRAVLFAFRRWDH